VARAHPGDGRRADELLLDDVRAVVLPSAAASVGGSQTSRASPQASTSPGDDWGNITTVNCGGTWPAFARELRERFEQRLRAEPHVPPARVELPDSAPTAFLCREHRDKPQAESLVPQLQMRGIKVWLDKQNLLCAGASEWL
jgi:hypothetical protein